MKKYSTVFFDLDGTLIDSGEGVTNSVAYALEKFGIYTENRTMLISYIGPPLLYSFQKYDHLDEESALKAIEYYREYYAEKGIYEYELYEEMEGILNTLKQEGYALVLATSKPEEFAKIILEHAGLSKYFDYIAGASMDEKTRITKDQVIEYALKAMKIEDPSEVVMVGDRHHDIEGARKFGMDCIGVLYGYGSNLEMHHFKPKYIAKTPAQIVTILQEAQKN